MTHRHDTLPSNLQGQLLEIDMGKILCIFLEVTGANMQFRFRTETQYVNAAEYNAWSSKYEEILIRRKKKWSALLKEAGLAPLDNEVPVRFPPRSQKGMRYPRLLTQSISA